MADYGDMTVDQLGQELEKRGLKKSGKKDELIARLEEDDSAAPAEEAPEEPLPRPRGEEAGPPPLGRDRAHAGAQGGAPRGAEGEVMVRARARYVRSAPRKARLVMEHIRGRPVEQARAILGLTPRAVSGDILKLLDSAVANAESNYELAADELRVQKAYVDEGPTIKRYRPRALGRATRINKRTSHMTIELTTQNEA